MKRILFSVSFFETDASGNSRARFEAGKNYPADDEEAKRCIARGIAAEVEVPDEPVAEEAPAEPAVAEAPAEAPEAAPAPAAPAPAPAAKSKK